MPLFSVIKDKLAQESDGQNGIISLKQRGPPLSVEVSPKNKPVSRGIQLTGKTDIDSR